MEDKTALLRSLSIDRDASPEPVRAWGGRRWLLVAIPVLLGVVVAAYWFGAVTPVTVVTPERESGDDAGLRSVLDASGYVVARRQATVSSKLTGKVVELNIEEGSRVEQGDIVARLDDSNLRAQLALAEAELEAARAQRREVQVQLAEAQRQLARTRELATQKLLSESVLDTAQASVDGLRARQEAVERGVTVAGRRVEVQRQQLDDTVVRAPFSGVVTVKNAQPGEMISPLSAGGDGTRTGIGTLVDMDSLEIEVDVNENFINRVAPGQPVRTTLNAYPDDPIESEVIAVIPTADRSRATVKVRVALSRIDERVLPEMGVRVSFLGSPAPGSETPAGEAARWWVPEDAVRQADDSDAVFVVEDGRARLQPVQTGRTVDARVLIVEGLGGNEALVRGEALATLSDGARVRVVDR